MKRPTGERIARLRKRHSLTQPELAKIMNVSQSTMTSWENDRRSVSNDDLIKLADFFEVTTDYLLGREVDDNLTVAAHMDDLTPEQKAEIKEFIEFKKAQYRKQHEKD